MRQPKFNPLRFQHLRIERGFTQEQFAEKLSKEINDKMVAGLKKVEVQPSTISRWESGFSKPSKRYLFAIHKVLEVKSTDLVTAGR